MFNNELAKLLLSKVAVDDHHKAKNKGPYHLVQYFVLERFNLDVMNRDLFLNLKDLCFFEVVADQKHGHADKQRQFEVVVAERGRVKVRLCDHPSVNLKVVGIKVLVGKLVPKR